MNFLVTNKKKKMVSFTDDWERNTGECPYVTGQLVDVIWGDWMISYGIPVGQGSPEGRLRNVIEWAANAKTPIRFHRPHTAESTGDRYPSTLTINGERL